MRIVSKRGKMSIGFEKMLSGKQSLFHWIIEHRDADNLHINLPNSLNDASEDDTMPHLQHKNDEMHRDISPEHCARRLLDMFVALASIAPKKLDDDIIDAHIGEIYQYAITYYHIDYIHIFLELFLQYRHAHKRLALIALATSKQFLNKGAHKEAIALALALWGLFELNEDELELFCTFGILDTFAQLVATGLERMGLNDRIFSLAQRTNGTCRIEYIERLDVNDEDKRKWLLFEGYKCKERADYVALLCILKGNLLDYIQINGFDKALYDATSEMLKALSRMPRSSFGDYPYIIVKTIALFVIESIDQTMSLQRFATLCALINSHFIESLRQDVREEFTKIVSRIASKRGIDWRLIVKNNPFDPDAQIIAKYLNISLFDDIFTIASREESFSQWEALCNVAEYQKVPYYKNDLIEICHLARKRLGLDSIKFKIQALGWHNIEIVNICEHIESIVRYLDRCTDEMIGLDFVEILLQSPFTRYHTTALILIKSWQQRRFIISHNILSIIHKNLAKSRDKEMIKRYQHILTYELPPLEVKMRLRVWAECGSSGIWRFNEEEKCFESVDIDSLHIPSFLADVITRWSDTFCTNALKWCSDDGTDTDASEATFMQQTLYIATELKRFFRHKARIEYYEQGQMKEVKYYYVLCDYDCYLWDEASNPISVNELFKSLDMPMNETIGALNIRFFSWSVAYFEFERNNDVNMPPPDELLQKGADLTHCLRKLLPAHYIVDYKHET